MKEKVGYHFKMNEHRDALSHKIRVKPLPGKVL